MLTDLKNYLKRIHETYSRGDAREESYYQFLDQLILQTAEKLKKKNVNITVMPKKTEGGNPDFRVWDGKAKIIGYIEAKKPEVDLDEVVESEQIKRYLKTFPNFILTNFLEFRHYQDGHEGDKVFIARQHTLIAIGHKPEVEHDQAFNWLFEKFFSFSFPKNLTAQQLAGELAKRTRFLRDQVVLEELKEKGEIPNGIQEFYEAFKTFLITGLTESGFADLYSQTVTYGLFAARTRSDGDFSRREAVNYIPRTIGILHDVFAYISIGQISSQMEWIIDDITEVLSSININAILKEFYQQGKGEDPIFYFYETFLAQYDPKLRESRGVYYTPPSVVSFIVRSLNNILKDRFGLGEGLANENVKVLDPAAGTMTFIAEAAKVAYNEWVGKWGTGTKNDFIREHLLKNYFAFELMMAPYTIGHMKMALILEEMNYRLGDKERVHLYLTNTLDMQDIEQPHIPGISTLSEESKEAGKIKKKVPILVILGNPPYSGISANMKGWIVSEIEKYKYVDGQHFHERKHWLQDDYVKFIRFAQWKIDQAGEGVIGFITNHGYLDNPTFRGMRQSLMKSFQEIYIVDLHGNATKKERCPDGSKDENVFDIKQGVTIAFFIKKKDAESECSVNHLEKWGLREEKYKWLNKNLLSSVKWESLNPNSPFYFFIPREEKNRKIFEKFIKITDIFPIYVTGIVTARDHFVIDFEKEPLKRRIEIFMDNNFPDDFIKQSLDLSENYMWRVSEARKQLRSDEEWGKDFLKILYRPFDLRYIFYHDSVVWRTRKKVMRHMLRENVGILLPKQVKETPGAFITENISAHKTVSAYDINYLFPLFLYPDEKQKALFKDDPELNRKANINEKLFERLEVALSDQTRKKSTLTPEAVFYYIYAVLYSNIYREKYGEFLKSDFPRVPFTKDYDLFIEMGKLGERLAQIHLMKSSELEETFAKFEGQGNNIVDKVKFAGAVHEPSVGKGKSKKAVGEKSGRVYINDKQFFSDIPEKIWEYQIGGYQVMEKWLKDRKGRRLSSDDIRHYIKIARALQLTIGIQGLIDEKYPMVEKSLLVV